MDATTFSMFFDNLPTPVVVCEARTLRTVYLNSQARCLIDSAPQIGRNLWELLNCPDQAIRARFQKELSAQKFVRELPLTIYDGEGLPIVVRLTANVAHAPDKRMDYCCIHIHEESKRKRTAAGKQTVYEVLRTVLDNVELPIYVSDIKTYELLFLNRFARRELVRTERNPEGQPCWRILQAEQQSPCPWCPLPHLVDANGTPFAKRYQNEFQNTKNGRWYLVTDYIIDWIDGRKVHMETAVDITEIKIKEEKLRHYASIDRMTGAYNREWGYRKLGETLRRSGERNIVSCLCFLDIDGLKNINDSLGHDAGDDLITSFVAAVKRCSRGGDILCRWGGDEFILCLYDCKKPQAKKIMEKIAGEFSQAGSPDYQRCAYGFSCGIVQVQPQGEEVNIDAVISAADQEMYESKNRKKRERVDSFAKAPQSFRQMGEGMK